MRISPEKWEAVKALFDAALEVEASEREAFLRTKSADDSVRAEAQRLLAEYEEAGTFLSSPALAAIPLSPKRQANRFSEGEILGGRFRILRFVAEGGMGEVYQAEDLELHELVAIKTLRPKTLHHTDALARFKREVHLARKVTHPNVCRIFDLYRHKPEGSDEVVILSMEFLRGETLAEHIKRQRRMSIEEALPLIRQMASALGAAHEAGIVHRDFKPSNVVLVQEPAGIRAVVTDFGLAFRETTHSDQQTLSGPSWHSPAPGEDRQLYGTPAYMAPEQIEGHPATIASDIYAFGLVIYEMVTSVRPFQGDTPISTAVKRLVEAPPPPRKFAPNLSPVCESVILQCLEREPANRFAKAQDVPAALAGEMRKATSGRGAIAALVNWPRANSYRRAAITAISIALMVVVGVWLFHRHKAKGLTEADTVVLADFTNTTGDPVFDDTLKQVLAVQLEQSPFLSILSDERARQTLRLLGRSPTDRLTAEVARYVCQRAGGKAILDGSIANLGSLYIVGLTATSCSSGESLAREKAEANRKEDVLKALDTAASSLRTKLGESLNSVRKFDAPTEQVTTPSLEALRAYSLGRDARNQQEDPQAAISHLHRAIELDANFAMAYAALGLSYWSIDESSRAARYTAKAYELRDRVTERERFRIVEMYHIAVTGDLEQRKHNDEQWVQSYPQDDMSHGDLGVVYLSLGQYEQSLGELLAAMRLNPDGAKYYENLGDCELALNRFPDAETTFKEGLRRGFDIFFIHKGLHDLAFLRGDEAEMQRQIAWSSGKPFAENNLLWSDSNAQAFYGHVAQARELMRRAIDLARSHGLSGGTTVLQSEEALREAEFGNIIQAREEVSTARRTLSNQDLPAFAVLALARARQTTQAEVIADALARQNPADTILNFYWLPAIRASIFINRGQPAQAIELLQPAIPYENSIDPALEGGPLYPAYLRGEAYLHLGKGNEAESEFQKFFAQRGLVTSHPLGALAHLGLARAYSLQGNVPKARTAYQDFFALWKDADSDIPILIAAKAEYAKLQ